MIDCPSMVEPSIIVKKINLLFGFQVRQCYAHEEITTKICSVTKRWMLAIPASGEGEERKKNRRGSQVFLGR
jgi:hypothetical protein